jgi:hypothetical protein
MDGWSEKQMKLMKAGGNQQCNDFLKKHGVDAAGTAREKYDTPAAQLYKQVLLARITGQPEPTELPKPNQEKKPLRKMEGFGSAPPPPEPAHPVRTALLVAVPVVAAGIWFVVAQH